MSVVVVKTVDAEYVIPTSELCFLVTLKLLFR